MSALGAPELRKDGVAVITDRQLEPRCVSCGAIILRLGTSCATCDTEAHFEGAMRSAPDVATQTMRGSHTLRRVTQAN